VDPSVLLKLRSPQWSDPLDDYSKLQTLRDLMDQRRIREQQYQLQQQAMQEHVRKAQYEQEDRQRAMNLSDLLTKNPEAPFPEIARVGGLGPALKIEQERLARQNAQRLAEKSALDVQGERAKREANTYAAVTALPQDQQQDWWDTNVGGGLPVDRPPTALEEQAKYAEAYGGEALQKRQFAADEEARKNALYKIDLPKHLAEANTAQQKAEGNQPLTQYQRAQLDALDTPGKVAAWMSDPKRTLEEKGRGEFILKKMKEQHPGQEQGDISESDLTPQGVDAAAALFARTGQMVALGQGKNGSKLRAKVINRAAEMYPSLDVAANKADFGANVQSLNQLQKQTDAINAFEKTAKNNIQIFLDQAKKIKDSGSPYFNKPIRTITRGMVGDENYLGFEAARRVAVNEIAKITSNPSLAGQLSDSARHEVESFIPQDATMAEVERVVKILTQDMENRKRSLDEQLVAIRQRINPQQQNNAPSGQTPTSTPPAKRKPLSSFEK
jgi:hypothetical protein